jgi:hypothetical protein|nr:MAG TPA: hypothetical protein [Caudoviricetes sp.]
MYDKDDLKMTLKAYSEMENCNLMGFVPILKKALRERLRDNGIHEMPPLVDENLQDVVSKCTSVTVVGATEPTKIEYNIEKMCGVFDIYFDKLVSVINFENARHNMIIDEIKKKEKPKTFSKVSRIISRVIESDTVWNPTYHDLEWFDKIDEDINDVLKDKTLSDYEFEVEFISTDTMSIAEEEKFKVITVMYFKLTEYIPDEE